METINTTSGQAHADTQAAECALNDFKIRMKHDLQYEICLLEVYQYQVRLGAVTGN